MKKLKNYIQDLKGLLKKGTITERKAFLHSFIKRIIVKYPEIRLAYNFPYINEKGRTSDSEVLPMCKIDSPICNIGRTFTHIFFLKPKNSNSKIVNHFYTNPICLAKKYRGMLDSGEVKNQAAFAQKLGISRVSVSKILSLLKLNSDLIDAVENIGNPMPTGIVTKRRLRDCQNSPALYKALLNRLRNFKK